MAAASSAIWDSTRVLRPRTIMAFDQFYLVNVFKSLLNFIFANLGSRGPNDVDVEVLFKSDDYIIVNKPEDVFVNNHDKEVSAPVLVFHPRSTVVCSWDVVERLLFDFQRPSVDLMLGKKYPHLVNDKLEFGFYFVHRLDYVTSGVLCLALNKRACAAASTAMQKRISRKYYVALLRGHVSENSMDLTNAIGNTVIVR